MEIQQATTEANRQGKFMYRDSWIKKGFDCEVMPTNTVGCCMLIPWKNNTETGSRWNPTMDDLVAKDWKIN